MNFIESKKGLTTSNKHDFALIQYLEMFSSVAAECFYVLDIIHRQFYCARLDESFLCGFSLADALMEGYNFYPKVVSPKDFSLLVDMYKAGLQYLKEYKDKRDEIDYFSCTFRLEHRYSFLSRPLPQMVFHRTKPVWEGEELCYLICSVESSTIKESGNLCMYNKDGLTYKEYCLTTRRWKHQTKKMLTEHEKAILMLAGQGKRTTEIADILYKGHNTIRNQIKTLFVKLNVHSIQEAIECTGYHRMRHPKQNIELQFMEVPRKKERALFIEDTLLRIQQHLDNGKSIREAGKLENIPESTIRSWIGKGRLKSAVSD